MKLENWALAGTVNSDYDCKRNFKVKSWKDVVTMSYTFGDVDVDRIIICSYKITTGNAGQGRRKKPCRGTKTC